MNLLYITNACPDEQFEQIFTGDNKPSQADQKYHNLQIQGLRKKGHRVTVLSIPGISRKTYGGLFFHRKNVDGYYFVPMLNIPVLRNICILLYTFFFVLLKTAGRTPWAILCDILNASAGTGTLLGAFFTRKQTVGIVTDVPTKRAFQQKGALRKLQSKLSYFTMGRFRKYIFLTEAMNSLINTKGRPYLVSEGHVDSSIATWEDSMEQKDPKRICLYAGSLRKIYGIECLVQGFLQAEIPDSELHIYGAGEYAQDLERLQRNCPSVKFFGVQANSAVVQAERRASLLINPRPSGEEYTKYSFPSKNMEYMVSGTPLLTTRLPGMPKDHEEYVFLIHEESPTGVAEALKCVFALSAEERFAFGQRAKSFVLAEKNNVRQAERITRLLEC